MLVIKANNKICQNQCKINKEIHIRTIKIIKIIIISNNPIMINKI